MSMAHYLRPTRVVALTDFNDRNLYGHISVAPADISTGLLPELGDGLELRDAEGNSCLGRVAMLQEHLVWVEPDYSSWSPGVQWQPGASWTNTRPQQAGPADITSAAQPEAAIAMLPAT